MIRACKTMRNSFVITPYSDSPRWILALLAAFVIGNVFGLVFFPPHTDEAYYWMLSERPGLSYFDHPPMVPWMMHVFTSIFGHNEWAFRLPAVLAWSTAAWVVFQLSTELTGSRKTGWTALLVFVSLPIYQAGFHIVGPDSGLMLFSALAYYFAARGVAENSARFWVVAGVMTGFGMLAKYNMVLVPAAIFLALLLNTGARQQLKKPWPWAAGFVALFCFLPVVIWNYQNDWASFAFQWKHGTSADTDSWFDNLVFYIVNQLGVALPWVFIAMVVASVKLTTYIRQKDSYTATLVRIGFWFPLVFFGVTNLLTKGHASWPAMAYIPGSILLGVALNRWLGTSSGEGRSTNRFYCAKVFTVVVLALFSLLAANLLRFPGWSTLVGIGPLPNSHASNGMGWNQVAARLTYWRELETRRLGLETACRAIALPGYDNDGYPYYLTAAELGLHLRDVYAITAAPGGRLTQFDYWRQHESTDSPVLCVAVTGPSNTPDLPMVITNEFGRWQRHEVVGIKTPQGSIRSFGFYLRRSP